MLHFGSQIVAIRRAGISHPLGRAVIGFVAFGVMVGSILMVAVLLLTTRLFSHNPDPASFEMFGMVLLAFAFGGPCVGFPLGLVSLLRGEHPRWPGAAGLILSLWPLGLVFWATRH